MDGRGNKGVGLFRFLINDFDVGRVFVHKFTTIQRFTGVVVVTQQGVELTGLVMGDFEKVFGYIPDKFAGIPAP